MSNSPTNPGSRSLVYGLSLLRLFTPEQPVLGIAELAELMGLSRPTAHRYASTCLELGYLEQAPQRRYRLTRRSAEPGMAMLGALGVTRAARPIVHDLRRQTGRTVSHAILSGDEVIYLQRLCGFQRGQYDLEHGLGAGSRRPARDTAAGRALRSALGAHPPTELSEIHHSGLTVDEGELCTDARGLAITVTLDEEQASAIELTVPAADYSARELIAELGEPLEQAAAALRARLLEGCADTCIAGMAS
jgi:DNA-binding IclR family transcriptional regulator